jgi:endonuclease/exonuclease/phosphatase family metal-dependent hydrolase
LLRIAIVKIITWNIQWGRGVDGRVDLDRIIEDIHRFSDFDVLCLQEVACGYPELPGNDETDQFAAIAQRLPDMKAIQGPAVDMFDDSGKHRSFGNMILSRFPVRQIFRHLLPWPAEPNIQSMQRIALEATLVTPLGAVRITTTHLEYYSAKQRHQQVECLRQLHQEATAHARMPPVAQPKDGPFYTYPRGGPAILTGNFNFLPEAPEKALLTSPVSSTISDTTPAYQDVWKILHPNQPHPPTLGLHDKVQWPGAAFTCDFVFISSDIAGKLKQIRVDSTTQASDHQPVMVEIG